jgi:hypothetical protein
MEHSSSWAADTRSDSQENSPAFMEPEGSLLRLQEYTTGPQLEPDQSNLHCPAYLPKVHFNIILPSTSRSLILQQ